MNNLLKIDPHRPNPRLLKKAASVIQAGGVVAFPTISFYGLGADALNETAYSRVFHIKNRPFSQPLPLFIPDVSWAQTLAAHLDELAIKLMELFWPGGLTLVFRAGEQVAPYLVSPDGSIGLRIPSHPIPAGLLSLLNRPVTGTSANLSSFPPCTTAACVQNSLTIQPDLILDGGSTPGQAASTVMDVSSRPFRIIRAGLVSEKEIQAVVGAAYLSKE